MPLAVKGMLFHPAREEKIRGARSLAGLKQAMVSGPNRHISTVTVSPILSGIREGGIALFFVLVTAKITSRRIAVPMTSAAKAGHVP